MGILYQAADPLYWVIWLFILFALMAFNELGRTSLWAGIALFAVVPIVLTVFVWPITAAPGNEYGTGTWFNWVKTYSALAGCYRAAVYCRLSKDDDLQGESASIANQRDMLEKYCEKHRIPYP